MRYFMPEYRLGGYLGAASAAAAVRSTRIRRIFIDNRLSPPRRRLWDVGPSSSGIAPHFGSGLRGSISARAAVLYRNHAVTAEACFQVVRLQAIEDCMLLRHVPPFGG